MRQQLETANHRYAGNTRVVAGAPAVAASSAATQEGDAALLLTSVTALRKSAERFQLLVEAIPNAIVIINTDGLIEMVNTQTERLFGYSRTELLGSKVNMLLPQDGRARHQRLGNGFFTVASSQPMEAGRVLLGQRKDGCTIGIRIDLSPIETDDGMMVLAAMVDISDRVRLEAERRKLQTLRDVSGVTAGVAHNFNNLLMTVGGSLELLLEEMTDHPGAVGWAKMALQATMRGQELTNRLLSFSRQQVLLAQPVAVPALFNEVQRLIGALFQTDPQAKTELVMVPCPPGLTVMADLAQLEAALIHLAVNACDAMVSGGRLRISARKSNADLAIVPPGIYTVISVADTGSGMDAETLAQACEPFFSTKGLNGTGLGLSMVQGFARQSGGEVHITSGVGAGTRIDLWLPLANPPPLVDALIAEQTAAATQVLVVDDSPDLLLVVSAFLRMSGLDVTTALSGELALAEMAQGKRFQAIVTDFAMPGMNGRELLTLARQRDPAISGMIMTGFSDPALLSELGDIFVLRKPFRRVDLVDAVQALIMGRPAIAPVRNPTLC